MKIAILDDHELIRVGVASVLHDSPHTVTISAACAEDLFSALEGGTTCDLLLLDILMPGTNGFEVTSTDAGTAPTPDDGGKDAGFPVLPVIAVGVVAGIAVIAGAAVYLAKSGREERN